MTPNVDSYLLVGCGRCALGGTPACKVNTWNSELKLLRSILFECGLNEEIKWGVPCYTFQKKNILILAAFKEHCSLSFFKGALLEDFDSLLQKPGENTQAARLIKFTHTKEIEDKVDVLKAYIFGAIELEKAGHKVKFTKNTELHLPSELQNKFIENPDLKLAFETLTLGRQRGYILHFSQPKQSKTREARIEKCIPQILSRKGLNEY